MSKFLDLAFAAGAAALCLAMQPAAADPVADFYKGKTITMIVPFAPGGTSAGLGQLIADHMGKHIPGNPAFKVEFMPGAGGLRGQNYAYNQAPRDGTTLFLPQDSSVVLQYLEPETAQFDSAKINWIGTVVQSKHILALRKDTGITSIEQLKEKDAVVGSSGAGSETDVYPRVTAGLLGLKLKVVPGYPGGSSEVMVAVESGEMDGTVAIYRTWSSRPDLFAQMTPVVMFGEGRLKQLPDVPNLMELVTDPDDQAIVRFISSIGPIGRAVGTTPEVPQERVEALRAAFDAMVKDPEFIKGIENFKLQLDTVLTGAELQAVVEKALQVSPEVVTRAKELIAVKE